MLFNHNLQSRFCDPHKQFFSDLKKAEKPTTGKWDSTENAIFLREVFKKLKISNINHYNPKTMEVPWTKLAEELREELDRNPRTLEYKWSNYIVPRLN